NPGYAESVSDFRCELINPRALALAVVLLGRLLGGDVIAVLIEEHAPVMLSHVDFEFLGSTAPLPAVIAIAKARHEPGLVGGWSLTVTSGKPAPDITASGGGTPIPLMNKLDVQKPGDESAHVRHVGYRASSLQGEDQSEHNQQPDEIFRLYADGRED